MYLKTNPVNNPKMATPYATLTKEVNALIQAKLVAILQDVAATYDLDKDELIEKYVKKPVVKKPAIRKKKDKDELIETEEYEWEGDTFLVDKKNNVYTNEQESPLHIGERLADGTIRLFNTLSSA